MIGPDQNLSDFPPWVWPYIRVEQLAKSRVFASTAQVNVESMPREVVLGHFVAIVQAVQIKTLAGRLEGSIGNQLGKAADQTILEELDDWCGTKPHPHPYPHRAAELATYLATFAASSVNDKLRGELSSVVEQITSRIGSTR